MAHEISVTFPVKSKSGKTLWVNASSVNPDDPNGPPFTEDQVRDRVISGVQKAHSISNSLKEARVKYTARSKMGMDAPAADVLLGKFMDK